jgi:hypothetical protein
LFWSGTSASLDLAALALLVKELAQPANVAFTCYLVPLALLPAIFFGAAVGKLSHDREGGIMFGLATEFVLLIGIVISVAA